jgi:hypothetical protein
MRKLLMMLTAATIMSAAALVGTTQASPIAPAGVATATQSTSAIQHVGWPGRWGPGWRRGWRWHHPVWGWRHPWRRGWRRW